jgi:hypothetical protein
MRHDLWSAGAWYRFGSPLLNALFPGGESLPQLVPVSAKRRNRGRAMPFGVRELGTALVVPCLTRYFPEARAFRNSSPYLRKGETEGEQCLLECGSLVPLW